MATKTNKQAATAKTDAVNIEVLNKLRKYAQFYFSKIIELNNKDGEYLRSGEYTADEMTDNSYKCVFGHSYCLPEDELFDGKIYISVGDFECEFIFRQIFCILAKWEKMMKIGKDKTIFKIGQSSITTAKVVTPTAKCTGYRNKTMQLKHITGKWYAPTRFKEDDYIMLIYKLGDVYFQPGLSFYGNKLASDKEFEKQDIIKSCNRYGDEFITNALQKELNMGDRDNYLTHVAKLAGMAPQVPAQAQTATSNEQSEQPDTAAQSQSQSAPAPTSASEPDTSTAPTQMANKDDLTQSDQQISNLSTAPTKCVTTHQNNPQAQCNNAA